MGHNIVRSGRRVLHKTRIDPLRVVPPDLPEARLEATCVCGWWEAACTGAEARLAVIAHCERDPSLPTFRFGAASQLGRRQLNTDAWATAVCDETGAAAFAVADDRRDDEQGALSAITAVRAAVGAALRVGSIAAVVAARAALRRWYGSARDTDVVVAVAVPGRGGYDVAWSGSCRAAVFDGEHVASVLTCREMEIDDLGWCSTGSGRLVLTSDGAHSHVTDDVMSPILREHRPPQTAAHRLVITADPDDNATALVVDRIHS